MALANSLTLKLAGITRDTPDPPGGAIVRDGSGRADRVLKDAAMDGVYNRMPAPTSDQIAYGAKGGDALRGREWRDQRAGYVGVAGGVVRIPATARAGELSVRVYGAQPIATWQR